MRWFPTDTAAQAGPSTTPAVPSPPPTGLPADHPPVPPGTDACPVNPDARAVWLAAASSSAQSSTSAPVPNAPAPAAAPTSRAPPPASLDTHRVVSSIPRSGADGPAGAAASPEGGTSSDGRWVYPSEQQFFNAMMRKNHKPRAADMRTVVPIHNAVNEKAWEQVLDWEAGMGAERCGGPRLSSFVGRPKDRTPKAWAMSLFGHDWIVDRCGVQVRYVIDFYTGRPDPRSPTNMAFHIDCRPALDSWDGVRTRVARLFRQ